uniref:Tudor domain-containing protein n=1 Tax=Rhabditophanes sp. KR3021 TaxID=114890 RepID=A0AC35TGU0_9BILA
MIALKSIERMPKSVKVLWEDGAAAQFSYLWLQDNTLRRPALIHIDLDAKPERLDCKQNCLGVTWPRRSEARFSSSFLRKHSLIKEDLLSTIKKSLPEYEPVESAYCPKILNEKGCLVTATALAPKIVPMGSIIWSGSQVQPGTIWPHFQQIPSLVSAQTMTNTAATLNLVDMLHVLALFEKNYPTSFDVLSNLYMEYGDAPFPFSAHHKMINIKNGKIISAIFNNYQRISDIPMQEEFYSALKNFGIVCSQVMKRVTIYPGQTLFIDNQTTLLGAPAECDRILKVCTYS